MKDETPDDSELPESLDSPGTLMQRMFGGESPFFGVKAVLHLVAILLLAIGWGSYAKSLHDADKRLAVSIEAANAGDFETADAEQSIAEGQNQEATFTGILLAFLTAGYVGLLAVAYVLPALAHKFTHTIYDSGEMVEEDAMRDARALVAQGDYPGAIEAYRAAAEVDVTNRVPWVEMARIHRNQLHDPASAAAVIQEALDSHEWAESDTAFLLFRLAETHHDHLDDKELGAQILHRIIDQFPETRHSANARHRLREWGMA